MSARAISKLKVRRGGPDEPERYETYDVPFEPGQSVLDGLRWVRRNEDASLAVRFACVNANACKECVIRINGKTGYACTTNLVDGDMLIEPLKNKRLIRDLVTDTVPTEDRLDD